MKRVLCLYRVSTLKQVDNQDDIPMQRRECLDYNERMDDWEFYQERMEKGVSGYKTSANDRDIIVEIKEMALRKEFDVLLVFMFDRIGRIPLRIADIKSDDLRRAVSVIIDMGVDPERRREHIRFFPVPVINDLYFRNSRSEILILRSYTKRQCSLRMDLNL